MRLPLAVGLGMALFVSGFILAVTSLSEPSTVAAEQEVLLAGGSGDQDGSVLLFMGLLLSLAGVVVATAVPAMLFIQARRGPA